MKNLIFIALFVFVLSCNEKAETTTATSDSAKVATTADVTYPYPAEYSSNFEMGNPEYGKMVLNLWKDFDNNSMDNMGQYFADSVTMNFPGMTLVGTRDSVVGVSKNYRAMYKEVKSTMSAVLSVKSTDKGHDWVLLWGKEVTTDQRNKMDSTNLQETWRINKDGKIDVMYQYKRDFPKK